MRAACSDLTALLRLKNEREALIRERVALMREHHALIVERVNAPSHFIVMSRRLKEVAANRTTMAVDNGRLRPGESVSIRCVAVLQITTHQRADITRGRLAIDDGKCGRPVNGTWPFDCNWCSPGTSVSGSGSDVLDGEVIE